MKIFCWAEGSASTGLGHLARQSVLAGLAKRKAGLETTLLTPSEPRIVEPFTQNFDSILHIAAERQQAEKATVILDSLPGQLPAWLVIDRPNYPKQIVETIARLKQGSPHLAIAAFDVAESWQAQWADLIVDANRRPSEASRFKDSKTIALFGPRYAVVAPEFLKARESFTPREHIETVVISMGGSDPNFLTRLALQACLMLQNLKIEAVLGPAFDSSRQEALQQMIGTQNVRLHRSSLHSQLASLLSNADVCIVSGGITMFEAACVGIPTLVIAQNEPQLLNARSMAEYGAIVNLGLFSKTTPDRIASVLDELIRSTGARLSLSRKAKATVDGRGGERILDAILCRPPNGL